MAIPVFRAGVGNRFNATSGSLTTPGTVVDGDWGVLVVANNDNVGSPTGPAGWTTVLATVSINTKQRLTVFAKQFVAGDASPTVTLTTAGNMSMLAGWWSGVSAVGVVGAVTQLTSGSISTAAAVTTSAIDNLVLSIASHTAGGSGFASAASVAPDAVIRASQYGAATFHHALVIADASKATAGATNDQTITWTNTATTATGGLQIALIPVAPPQTWVPTTDTGATITGWTKTPSGAAGTYAVLADTDPTTYIESGDNPTTQVWQSPTFSLIKPLDLTSVKVKVSGYLATGTTGSRTAQLYQGATLIKGATFSLTGVDAETVISLNSTEAGSITTTSGQWLNLSVKVSDTAS